MAMLDDEELQAIYTWVDEIPLSRPKRNISRDFSDGVLAAEIVYHYFPQLVELHNYSAANAVSGKMYNWRTMNQKVFKKLGFSVPKEELEDIVNARPGAVERLLKTLRKHMARYRARGGRRRRAGPGSEAGDASFASGASASEGGSPMAAGSARRRAPGANGQAAGAGAGEDEHPEGPTIGAYAGNVDRDALKREVDAELLTEKEQEIQDLRETVELLDRKVQKLEQLVRLKDSKIQTLQSRLAGGEAQ